jgi:membrane-bound lytic murein transglycosylase D
MRVFCLLLFLMVQAVHAQTDVYIKRIAALCNQGLPCFYNEQVDAEIVYWLQNEEEYTSFMLGRSEALLGVVDKALAERGLPGFLRYIPIANTNLAYDYSGYDGASGSWPLSFAIAKRYGLKMNSYIDERRSREKAAKAATAYLAELYRIYRDWKMVITAFRIGPVELNKAIRLAGNTLNYDSVHFFLPEAYQAPMVRYMGMLYIFNFHALHGIKLKTYVPEQVDTVWSACAMPFKLLEEKLSVKPEDLRFFNPVLRGAYVPHVTEPVPFYLPAGLGKRYNLIRDSLCMTLQPPPPTAVLITSSSPDTVFKQIPVAELPAPVPGVPPPLYDTIVRVVDSVTYIEVRPHVAPKITPASAAKVWVYYTVKSGDALYTLADVFDCTVANAKSWNALRSNSISSGRKLKFYVPAAKAAYYRKINTMTLAQKRSTAARD